ncbi:MAG: hypothetical protein ACXVHK_31980, partial [Solirubrobacteraceae bacterium]
REVMMPLLWVSRIRYASPLPPSDEGLREAWELGKRSRARNTHEPPSWDGWSRAKRRAFISGFVQHAFSKDLQVPPAWPVEACFLAVEAAQTACFGQLRGRWRSVK